MQSNQIRFIYIFQYRKIIFPYWMDNKDSLNSLFLAKYEQKHIWFSAKRHIEFAFYHSIKRLFGKGYISIFVRDFA